jgi:POT family proton-dependent oligopeptide transporter
MTATVSAETSTSESSPTSELFGHPTGLYVCFATELWERFSFYGMKYLLLLYLTKYHLFSDGAGFDVLGAYAGLVYALPVIGGLIADRYLGFRKSVIFGGILLSLGHLLMAVEGHQAVPYEAGATLPVDVLLANGTVLAAGTVLAERVVHQDLAALNIFYLALTLIVMGVGFLKPNISTIVGKLYGDDHRGRDSGFTIFYMGINIGSVTATLLCGWLGETYGWSYGFGAAGVGMVLGLFTFIWGQKYLYGHAEPREPQKLKESVLGPINRENLIYLACLPAMVVVWLIVQDEPVVHITQNIFLIISIVGVILYSMLYHDSKNKMTAYAIAGLAIALGVGAALFQTGFVEVEAIVSEITLYAAVLVIVGFVIYGNIFHKSDDFQRTVVLMILIVSTIVFWALFEQSAGSMTLYADRITDRVLFEAEVSANNAWVFKVIGGCTLSVAAIVFVISSLALSKNNGDFVLYIVGALSAVLLPLVSTVTAFAMIVLAAFYKSTGKTLHLGEANVTGASYANIAMSIGLVGAYVLYLGFQYGALATPEAFVIEPTASNFGALNAGFIVLLAVPIAWLWTWLDSKNKEPSTPVKFALGIFQVGLGFGALVIGAQLPDESGKVAAVWLTLAYLLHTTGELCLSPVGLSAVTKLSIKRVVGMSMGIWFLATALSETVATRIGKLAAIDTSGAESADIFAMAAKYSDLFEFLLYLGCGVGVFMIVISPLLRKWMHGVH